MSIPKSFIDQVLDQTNIVDIISRRIEVNKKGNRYWCKCPFHDDNNPSMSISEEKQFFYCFVCQKSGNAIHFLRDFESLDFVDAIEVLAHQLGLEVPQQRQENQILPSKLVKSAVLFYTNNLKSSAADQAKSYLKERGITGETARYFMLGYALNKWDSLYLELKQSSSDQELDQSGLFVKKDRGFYDRFRDRIIFPIRNAKGQFVAMGGRIIAEGEPKYLNSPETSFFNKSNELFGLFEAKDSKATEALIVVEGYMDVIGLFQHGINNAVATLGTAVTSNHISKILRYTKKIYFAFDGDQAGQKAAWKALETTFPSLRKEVDAKFIFFEAGEDPDSFINTHGIKAFNQLLEEAVPLSEYFLNRIKEFDLDHIEGKSQAASFAMNLIDSINNEFIKEVYLQEVSKLCDMDIKKLASDNPPRKRADPSQSIKIPNNQSLKVQALINIFRSLIAFPALASLDKFKDLVTKENFSFLKQVLTLYSDHPKTHVSDVLEIIENEKIKSYFSQAVIEELDISEKDAHQMINDCINVLLKSQKDREEMLKDKYNNQSISAEERRELQQLILKKLDIDEEDQELLSELSAKKI